MKIEGLVLFDFRPFGEENVVEYRLECQHPTRDEVSMFQTKSWYTANDYQELGFTMTPLTQERLDEEKIIGQELLAIRNNWWGRQREALSTD